MSTGILASFFYYGRYDFSRLPRRVGLILDSGAFSAYTSGAEVSLDDYGRWLASLSAPDSPVAPRFAFNLDVLADAPASLANWRRLKNDHGQITVPVVHYGTRPHELEPYIEEGADRIALGGVATGSGGRQALAWAAHVLRYLGEHHPDIPTHGLGVHMRGPLARLPWTTTDSSSFTSAWRYARLAIWIPSPSSPGRGRWTTVDLDGRAIYRYGATLRRYYETTPEAIERSTPDKRTELVKVATRIEVRAATDWDLIHPRPVDRYNSSGSDLLGGDQTAHEIDRYLVDTYEGHLEAAAREVS